MAASDGRAESLHRKVWLHMPNIGPMELIVVLVLALVVLGPKRLPDAGRSLGKGLREFKSAIGGGSDELDTSAFTAERPKVAAAQPASQPVAVASAEHHPA